MERKEFEKLLKAICYQLFNRKLMFLILKGDPLLKHHWLFTNVDYNTMLIYDNKPEYYYQQVEIQHNEFVAEFYRLFPALLNTPCILRVVDFVSTLSKISDLSTCSIIAYESQVMLNYPTPDGSVEKPIGIVMSDLDVETYYRFWSAGICKSDHTAKQTLNYPDLKEDTDGATGVWVADCQDDPNRQPRKALAVLHKGLLVPSLDQFTKAIKDAPTTFIVKSGYDGDSILINTEYLCSLLCTYGTQHAQRWFVQRIHV